MITEHVSYLEIVRSDTAKRRGIENVPNLEQSGRIQLLCHEVFEPLRNHFGVPIFISSCFRSKALNKALRGAKNSQHMANNGAAMDLDAHIYGKVSNEEIGDYIRNNLDFDQLIYEGWDTLHRDYAWIHVSYNEGNNRNQVLIMERKGGKTIYRLYNG